MRARTIAFSIAALAVAAQPALAQTGANVAVSAVYQGYSFPAELGSTSATLALVPVVVTLPVSRAFSFDVYSAYARGSVKTEDKTHTLEGLVDTRVRATFNVTPSVAFTGSLNLPTGKATHDADEAVVAAGLSTELLGFREALWGTGFGATAGVLTAWRAGNTGIGIGASYRLAGEFEPDASSPIKYAPGNETRVRVAIDQDIGANKLTVGATFQNYADDQLGGRNLFAPGNRWRGDAAYSFRSSAVSSWTLFATDVWRENGDVSLQALGQGDSTLVTGQQNLAIFGIAGGTRIGSGLALRPSADFRMLTRKSGANEGWLAGLGTEIPMRRGNTDWIPTFRLSYGQMEATDSDTRHNFWGGEASLTLRFGH